MNEISYFHVPAADDYVSAAAGAGEFVINRKENAAEDPTLYSGQAGIAVFLLRLYIKTGDEKWVDQAVKAGDGILEKWNGGKAVSDYHDFRNSRWGLVLGRSGIAWAIYLLGKISGEERFTFFTHEYTKELADAAVRTENGVKWSGLSGIVFDAGIIAYLSWAAKEFKNDELAELADEAGSELASKALKENGLSRWKTIDPGIGLPKGGQAPNFYYGTAGNAYAMALLHQLTGKVEYLSLAAQGAAYMESISLKQEKKLLFPMYVAKGRNDSPVFVGVCNGYAGTARLFVKLLQITGDPHYRDVLDEMTEGITAAGAPEVHFKGYWNTCTLCCGAGGMLNAVLGIYRETGDERYFSLAKRTGKYILGQSTPEDDGRKWYQSYVRLDPADVDATAGYFNGAAGIGAELLDLADAMEEDPEPAAGAVDFTMPDEPYGRE